MLHNVPMSLRVTLFFQAYPIFLFMYKTKLSIKHFGNGLSLGAYLMAESSFQRLLLRMPEDARRRFCCSALEQELLEAKNCVSDCVEAAAHAQQVREATLKLQTNSQSGTPVTSKSTPAIVVLLAEVDELQKRIEASLTVLGQPYKVCSCSWNR